MKSLFIPTSTLNFNNIFSTESISPASFYQQRGFGYKRFEYVEPNPYQDKIVAYSRLPFFTIKESVYESYPIVFEINIENNDTIDSTKTIKNDIEIYELKRTVYFSPETIKVHFFDEKSLKSCIIKAEPSLETKLVDLYKSKFVITNTVNSFEWNKNLLPKSNEVIEKPDSNNISLDQKINRIKGLFYSYIIGVLKSPVQKVIELTQLQTSCQRLIEEFLDISNTEILKKIEKKTELLKTHFVSNKCKNTYIDLISMRYSHIFDKGQLEYFKTIKPGNQSFLEQLESQIDKSYLNSHFTIFLIDELSKILKSQEVDISLKRDETKILWQRINSEISNIIKEYNSNKETGFNPRRLSISNLKLTAIEDNSFQGNGAEVFRYIANMLMGFPISNAENFKESKADIAFEIGKILKEEIKNWDGSNEQRYINGLLANIESYVPFDLKSHNSSFMQSISSFIIKGDDPEKLLAFLDDNNIQNKRIALAFWGSAFGFASLPKTLFNSLFNDKNKSLAIESYCYLYKQIHSFEIRSFNFEYKTSLTVENVVKEEASKIKPHSRSVSKETKKEISKDPNVPKCPKCGADMVLRDGKRGKFYGCSNYPKTSCNGSLDYKPMAKKDDNTDKLSSIIVEYVKKNGHCKISKIITFINDRINKKYNVRNIESYIKDFLKEELEFKKIKSSKGVMMRDKGMFPNI